MTRTLRIIGAMASCLGALAAIALSAVTGVGAGILIGFALKYAGVL